MRVLVLPTLMEALRLEHPTTGLGPLCDPSVLPWVDGRTGLDQNPDRAWSADEMTAQPFDSSGSLEVGVHLNWVLPNTVRRARHPLDPTTGQENLTRVDFPRAPDRWLITRSEPDGEDWRETARWLVESDFVHPPNTVPPRGTIAVLLPPWARREGEPPSRGLGRVRSLAVGAEPPSSNAGGWEDITGLPLTALGPWEELTFAALYPNCRNVFALHDPSAPSTKLRYELVGWYGRPERDVAAQVCQQALKNPHFQRDGEALHAWLGPDADGLTVEEVAGVARLSCFGVLDVAASKPTSASSGEANIQLALGETLQHALVAHIADDVDEVLPGSAAVAEKALMALGQSEALTGVELDLGPRMQHAEHRAGFRAVAGGDRWQVVRRRDALRGDEQAPSEELTLPDSAAHALERLNRAQFAHDKQVRELGWRADQLAADQARLARAIARPIDRPQDMPDLDEAFDDLLQRAGVQGSRKDSLASGLDGVDRASDDIAVEHAALSAIVAAHNGGLTEDQQWDLLTVPATRFWEPLDPAVLLSSETADGLIRRSPLYHDAPPHSRVISLVEWSPTALSAAVPAGLRRSPDNDDHNPLLLEWRVEVQPTRASRHIDPQERGYERDWLSGAYRLGETDQDLVRRDTIGAVMPAAVVIQGRSLLTPSSPDVLVADIHRWLARWIERRARTWQDADSPTVDTESIPSERSDLIRRLREPALPKPLSDALKRTGIQSSDAFFDWLAKTLESPDAAHPVQILIEAHEALEKRDGRVLGQQLSGFNRALLGLQDGLPLEVSDPLGFREYHGAVVDLQELLTRALTRARGVQRPRTTPRPDDEFLPVRAGDLRVLALRLTDSFGRATDLRWTELDRPASMASPFADRVTLAPRFTQAARLDFRWLAANPYDDTGLVDVESTPHPAASPICGWLVADWMDRAILVYDQAGVPLGSVEVPGLWRLPPGPSRGLQRPSEIANAGLRSVVQWMVDGARKGEFLDELLDSFEAGLDATLPEGSQEHDAQVLLSGRPIAVVRARVRLELATPPDVDQGWHAYRRANQGASRSSRGFENVGVPVRIGEHRMLDDGVIGFFVEDGDGSLVGDRLSCPQGLEVYGGPRDSRIEQWRPGADALNIEVSASDGDHLLTVLMDPRGHLHATCGMLPTRALTLPADQYRPALERIAPWIRVMPTLSGPGDLELDLPSQDLGRWRWLARTPDGWERRDPGGSVRRAEVVAAASAEIASSVGPSATTGADVWDALVDSGLVSVDDHDPDLARFADKPAGADSPELPAFLTRLIHDRIVSAPRGPVPGPTTAREGWLQLGHAPAKES